ncbi:MAG: hypothetical protein D6E12_02035 [Desulfovibrio sp.]|nr:MAG: hypothetical protein D6E12_02035 [Desulfovibrio sp.]
MTEPVFKGLIVNLFATFNLPLPERSVLKRWFELLGTVSDLAVDRLLFSLEQEPALPRNLPAAILDLNRSLSFRRPDHVEPVECISPYCIHGRILARKPQPGSELHPGHVVFRCALCRRSSDLAFPARDPETLLSQGYVLKRRDTPLASEKRGASPHCVDKAHT